MIMYEHTYGIKSWFREQGGIYFIIYTYIYVLICAVVNYFDFFPLRGVSTLTGTQNGLSRFIGQVFLFPEDAHVLMYTVHACEGCRMNDTAQTWHLEHEEGGGTLV